MYNSAMSNSRTYGDQCGVARSLDIIGERWALLIVRELLLGPKRFSDLSAGLTGASPNVISQRLRELTGDGVVRHRDLGPPARVQVYELTEWGRELEPVVLQLGLWGERTPIPEGAPPSLDSLLLAIQAKADPGTVQGVYELHIGADSITVRAAAGAVRIRHGTTEQPAAILSTDGDTLRAVCFGQRSVEDAVKSGDLTLDGTDSAIAGLTELLLTLIRPT